MDIEELTKEIRECLHQCDDTDQKVELINRLRMVIHEASPFRDQPADCVLWIKQEQIRANEYNPNHVAAPEMELLHTSIKEDGYTMPIVTYDMKDGTREIVDGFHRSRIGREYEDINGRIRGYLPVTTLERALDERIGSTIRHNRARGTHGIRPMSEIVLELTRYGWNDERICKELGMDLDEVVRLKQITGLKEAFQNHDFSKSWEEFESKYYGQEK